MLENKAICRSARASTPLALGACCRASAPSSLLRSATSVLVRRPFGSRPRVSTSRSADRAMLVSDGAGWRPVATAEASAREPRRCMPPSRVDRAAAEPRMGCWGALMARWCSFVHRLQLLRVEGRGGTVRAKHERSRLGLVTRLETLVPYQTHQDIRKRGWNDLNIG